MTPPRPRECPVCRGWYPMTPAGVLTRHDRNGAARGMDTCPGSFRAPRPTFFDEPDDASNTADGLSLADALPDAPRFGTITKP